MTKERTMYQLPDFLKFGMIISEILIINLIFYYFYTHILSKSSADNVWYYIIFLYIIAINLEI